MIIKEFRIILPISVEEYQVAQLWSVAEASKNETGGGEGVEVISNEPYDKGGDDRGQFTHKVFHLASRLPKFLAYLAPKGSLEFHEQAWNAYPYCKTVITNPPFMKDDFKLSIESWHKTDFGDSENVHNLEPDLWKKTEVIYIDIVNDSVNSSDYKPEQDPKQFCPKAEGREQLTCDWIQKLKAKSSEYAHLEPKKRPYMCAYKLVRCNFKWFGLQNGVENFVHRQEKRIFNNFHRQVYCWMDNWYGLTMADIRMIEDRTRDELNDMRVSGCVKGTRPDE